MLGGVLMTLHEDLSLIGCLVRLGTASALLMTVVTCGVAVSGDVQQYVARCRRAMGFLIRRWILTIPITFTIHDSRSSAE
jgi:hypothetical protein